MPQTATKKRTYRTRNFLSVDGREQRTILIIGELAEAIERARKTHRRSFAWEVEHALAFYYSVRLRYRKCKNVLPAWGEQL